MEITNEEMEVLNRAMSPTNEEIEVLNRASEILSKYAAIGGLSRQDFDHFEKMVIAIFDERGSNIYREKQEQKELLARLTGILQFIITNYSGHALYNNAERVDYDRNPRPAIIQNPNVHRGNPVSGIEFPKTKPWSTAPTMNENILHGEIEASKGESKAEKEDEETNTRTVNRIEPKLPEKRDIIQFGRYPESSENLLRWIILDVSDTKYLLVSESAIVKRAYHNPREIITWERSSLRAWLNGPFFNIAFNLKEKAAIVKSDIDNSIIQGYIYYDAYGGTSTKDKVFLLSYTEAWKYFKYDDDRKIPREKWWLRSPGYSQDTAAYVGYHGERCSDYVNQNNISIRPALWVESTFIESIYDATKVLPTNSERTIDTNPKTSSTKPLRDYLVNGSYSEKLFSGGELKVRKDGWSIEYYFPGPDRRYNGTFVSIPGQQVDKYIQAWKFNFTKYEDLKRKGLHGELQTDGDLGMTIRIGGYAEGVCLRSYHMPKRSKEEIDRVIKDYQYAKNRANSLMGK